MVSPKITKHKGDEEVDKKWSLVKRAVSATALSDLRPVLDKNKPA